ncbi:MAG: transposase [Promethearchaeota archaeon Loki_b32]|nr:MAG: transposase [Candidatus Lokiarchaeota archaeon Loki_b32]
MNLRLSETIYKNSSDQLSKLCHLAKNLYNLANWYVRQDFLKLNNFLNYYDLEYILKDKQAYRKLPSQTSQQILKLVNRNWKSYFGALKEYRTNPKKFKNKPRIPHYKRKNGESIVIFTNQQCRIKQGYLNFPKKVNLKLLKTRIKEKLKEVRIIPLGIKYKIEIIYEKEEQDLGLNKKNLLSIDLGVNNLITAVNNIGLDPIIIKGKVIKSINQYYNKQLAYYRSIENKKSNFQDTKRIQKLHLKRNNKIYTIFHRISRLLINYCIKNNLGTIIIGYNEDWKQNINIGKKNNQKFAQIPFLKLINQVKYKSELVGITVITINENHTSKCSFFDNEEIRHHKKYLGKRISRGLFRTSNGTLINADVNAGFNIMKKVFPNSVQVDGIEAFGLMPQKIQQNIVDTII